MLIIMLEETSLEYRFDLQKNSSVIPPKKKIGIGTRIITSKKAKFIPAIKSTKQ